MFKIDDSQTKLGWPAIKQLPYKEPDPNNNRAARILPRIAPHTNSAQCGHSVTS